MEAAIERELLERVQAEGGDAQEAAAVVRRLSAEALLRREEARELSSIQLPRALRSVRRELQTAEEPARKVLLKMDLAFLEAELARREDGAASEAGSVGQRSPTSPSGLPKSVAWLDGMDQVRVEWALARETATGMWAEYIVSTHHEALLFYEIGHVRQRVALGGGAATAIGEGSASKPLRALKREFPEREFFGLELRLAASKFLLASTSAKERDSWQQALEYASTYAASNLSAEEAAQLSAGKVGWANALIEGFLFKRSSSTGAMFGVSPKWKRRYCRVVLNPERTAWTLCYYSASRSRVAYRLRDVGNLAPVDPGRVLLPSPYASIQRKLGFIHVELNRGLRPALDVFAVHEPGPWLALVQTKGGNRLKGVDEVDDEVVERGETDAESLDDDDEDASPSAEPNEEAEKEVEESQATPLVPQLRPPPPPPLDEEQEEGEAEEEEEEDAAPAPKAASKANKPALVIETERAMPEPRYKPTSPRGARKSGQESPRARAHSLVEPAIPIFFPDVKTGPPDRQPLVAAPAPPPAATAPAAPATGAAPAPGAPSAPDTSSAAASSSMEERDLDQLWLRVEELTQIVEEDDSQDMVWKEARKLVAELSMLMVTTRAQSLIGRNIGENALSTYFCSKACEALSIALLEPAEEHSRILTLADEVSCKSQSCFDNISLGAARVVKRICALAQVSTEALFAGIRRVVDGPPQEDVRRGSLSSASAWSSLQSEGWSRPETLAYDSEEFSDCDEARAPSPTLPPSRAPPAVPAQDDSDAEGSPTEGPAQTSSTTIAGILRANQDRTVVERLSEQIALEAHVRRQAQQGVLTDAQAQLRASQTTSSAPRAIPSGPLGEAMLRQTNLHEKVTGPNGKAWLDAIAEARKARAPERAPQAPSEKLPIAVGPAEAPAAAVRASDAVKPRESLELAPPPAKLKRAKAAQEAGAWMFKRSFRDATWQRTWCMVDQVAKTLVCSPHANPGPGAATTTRFPLRGSVVEWLGQVPASDAIVAGKVVSRLIELALTTAGGEWLGIAFETDLKATAWYELLRPLCGGPSALRRRSTRSSASESVHSSRVPAQYDENGRRLELKRSSGRQSHAPKRQSLRLDMNDGVRKGLLRFAAGRGLEQQDSGDALRAAMDELLAASEAQPPGEEKTEPQLATGSAEPQRPPQPEEPSRQKRAGVVQGDAEPERVSWGEQDEVESKESREEGEARPGSGDKRARRSISSGSNSAWALSSRDQNSRASNLAMLTQGVAWHLVRPKRLALEPVWLSLDGAKETLLFAGSRDSKPSRSVDLSRITQVSRGRPSAHLLNAAVEATRPQQSRLRSAMPTSDWADCGAEDSAIAQDTFLCALRIDVGNGVPGYEEAIELLAPDPDACAQFHAGLCQAQRAASGE